LLDGKTALPGDKIATADVVVGHFRRAKYGSF
jgi:hypothetical protein